jgi:hypothetical protein
LAPAALSRGLDAIDQLAAQHRRVRVGRDVELDQHVVALDLAAGVDAVADEVGVDRRVDDGGQDFLDLGVGNAHARCPILAFLTVR